MLEQTASGKQKQSLYLWGESGCGKSHLLQACCKRAAENNISVAYLPMQVFRDKPASILEGLDQQQLVCVDDLHVIAGDRSWEEALFHLYNALNDREAVMLMTATVSPTGIKIGLADLKSRLGWGLVYQLQSLSEEEKYLLLKRKADLRGFELPDEVIEYLKVHCRRDLHSLLSILDRIDQASITEQRKITVPFVKTLI